MSAGVLVWLLLAQPLDAARVGVSDPAETFVRANGAYESGDYAAAVDAYLSLTQAGSDAGWAVHYNLGNSQLRRGDLGVAIASYLRARRRAPRNQDVAANLAYARRSAKDAISPPESSALVRTAFFWHYSFDRDELVRALVVLNLGLWCLAGWRLFRPGSELLLWSCLGVLILVVAVGGSIGARALVPQRVAVVVPLELEARSSYAADSVVRFKLHAGSEVRLEEVAGDWARVSLPDGEGGWVEADGIEVVEL